MAFHVCRSVPIVRSLRWLFCRKVKISAAMASILIQPVHYRDDDPIHPTHDYDLWHADPTMVVQSLLRRPKTPNSPQIHCNRMAGFESPHWILTVNLVLWILVRFSSNHKSLRAACHLAQRHRTAQWNAFRSVWKRKKKLGKLNSDSWIDSRSNSVANSCWMMIDDRFWSLTIFNSRWQLLEAIQTGIFDSTIKFHYFLVQQPKTTGNRHENSQKKEEKNGNFLRLLLGQQQWCECDFDASMRRRCGDEISANNIRWIDSRESRAGNSAWIVLLARIIMICPIAFSWCDPCATFRMKAHQRIAQRGKTEIC